MSNFALLFAAMTTYFTLANSHMAAAQEGVEVKDAYARVTGDSATSAAIFMTLINHSIEDDRLLSVTADVAGRAELHSHSLDANGVMHMGEITEGFPIMGQKTHVLDRGGDHIMLMGLTKTLKQGDLVTLILDFQLGEKVTVKVPVDNARKPDPVAHDMGSMKMPATE